MVTDKMKKLTKSDSNPHFFGNYCLVYATINLSSVGKTVKLLNTLSARGVNVSKILEYEVDSESKCTIVDFERYQDGWILSSKISGMPIHDDITYIKATKDISDIDLLTSYYKALRTYSKNIATYVNLSQDVIDKLVVDYYAIYKSELMMDVSVNNVLFDGVRFGFINLRYSEGAKNKLGFFIRELLDLIIFQPPYILLESGTIIDDIPREMYNSLSNNIKLLLDKIMAALSNLPISRKKIENDVLSYLVTKENLIHGGISQDELLNKLYMVYIEDEKKEYC